MALLRSPIVQIAGDLLFAARQGHVTRLWTPTITPGAGVTVLAVNVVHNLQPRMQVLITHFCFGVTTVSKNAAFELVSTTQPNGAGVVTALTRAQNVYTGAAIAGHMEMHRDLVPPIRVRYVDGMRSITVRITADGTTALSTGWTAIVEPAPL